MMVLVACEESQAVCKAFRASGHDAFSCDLAQCSGGHTEWHIIGDVLHVINGNTGFDTCDGTHHEIKGHWDMVIAFPPCTHLAASGARWFAEKQKDLRQQKAVAFFMQCALAHCDKVAVENPVGIMSSVYRKPDQIIQPWQFGHPESKKTCLWLKGLPALVPTNVLRLPDSGRWNNQTADGQNRLIVDGKWIGYNDPRTPYYRSKTYDGIANAMAEQWGGINE